MSASSHKRTFSAPPSFRYRLPKQAPYSGIALGYATLGQIGFEGRFQYAAIGSSLNLASRLCGQAENGQILVTQRIYAEIEDIAESEPLGELTLKGFLKPVPAFNVTGLKAGESRSVGSKGKKASNEK